MNKEEFVECLIKKLSKALGENVCITKNDVIKTNDTQLTGICIRKEDEAIGPNIYIDAYYEQHEKGKPFDEIADEIVSLADHEVPITSEHYELLKNIADYEIIRKNTAVKLVNKKRNEEYLKNKLYKDFLDLAICFYIHLEDVDNGTATVTIPSFVQESWNVTDEELLEQALQNMKEMYKPEIIDIFDVVGKMVGDSEAVEERPEELVQKMFVISNGNGINGASSILHKEMLKDFAQKHNVKEVYILPSSIHECILLPSKECNDKDYLCQMVRDVNETQVSSGEVLSDHIYIYNAENNEITGYEKEE